MYKFSNIGKPVTQLLSQLGLPYEKLQKLHLFDLDLILQRLRSNLIKFIRFYKANGNIKN